MSFELTRDELRAATLRAQLWRLAAQTGLSEPELIQGMLDIVGPALGVSRAGFVRLEGDAFVSALQWCAPGIQPSLGARLPRFLVEPTLRAAGAELDVASAVAALPPEHRTVAAPLFARFAADLGLTSWLAVPLSVEGQPEGALIFERCGGETRGWSQPVRPLIDEVAKVVTHTIEAHRARVALRESERRFRELVDLLPVGVVEAAVDGRITFANRQAREDTGRTDEVVRAGLRLADLFVLDQASAAALGSAADLAAGSLDRHEVAIRRRDGTTYRAAFYASPIRRGAEQVGLRCVLGNLTELQRVEDARRLSEATLHAIFELATDSMFLVGDGGRVLEANRAACRHLGYSAEELRRLKVTDFVAPAYHAEVQGVLDGVADPLEYHERIHRRRDGSEVPVEVSISELALPGQRLWVGIARDVTARRRAEQALRESEQRYRALADLLPQVVFEADFEGNLTFLNRHGRRLFGISDQAAQVELNFLSLLVPEHRGLADQRRREVLSGMAHEETEYRAVTRDGRVVDLLVYGTPVMQGSSPVGVRGVAIDITEKKRAEVERRQLETQMQHAQKLESLGLLAGGIAHDFNNLLVGMLGNAELALAELAGHSTACMRLGRIKRAAQRASELANQMLAYSGKGPYLVEVVDLSVIVDEMAGLLEAAVPPQGELRFGLCRDLPAVEADVTQIRQVVMNLILNAAEALGNSPGSITVATGVSEEDHASLAAACFADGVAPGRFAYLEVADSGGGMDEETQRRIFDPFFTTKFTGRGLGLAATLGIVRRHGGVVKLTSAPGCGTTFRVLLPVSTRAATALPAAASRPVYECHGRGLVLVVDDEEDVRDVAVDMLRALGFEACAVADGAQALELVQHRRSELRAILLDVTMPRMSGEETFDRIRLLAPDIPILLASGYGEEVITQRFAGRRPTGVVRKPFDLETLASRLRLVLEVSDSQ